MTTDEYNSGLWVGRLRSILLDLEDADSIGDFQFAVADLLKLSDDVRLASGIDYKKVFKEGL